MTLEEERGDDPLLVEMTEQRDILASYLRALITMHEGRRLSLDGPDVLERAARTLALFDGIGTEDEW